MGGRWVIRRTPSASSVSSVVSSGRSSGLPTPLHREVGPCFPLDLPHGVSLRYPSTLPCHKPYQGTDPALLGNVTHGEFQGKLFDTAELPHWPLPVRNECGEESPRATRRANSRSCRLAFLLTEVEIQAQPVHASQYLEECLLGLRITQSDRIRSPRSHAHGDLVTTGAQHGDKDRILDCPPPSYNPPGKPQPGGQADPLDPENEDKSTQPGQEIRKGIPQFTPPEQGRSDHHTLGRDPSELNIPAIPDRLFRLLERMRYPVGHGVLHPDHHATTWGRGRREPRARHDVVRRSKPLRQSLHREVIRERGPPPAHLTDPPDAPVPFGERDPRPVRLERRATVAFIPQSDSVFHFVTTPSMVPWSQSSPCEISFPQHAGILSRQPCGGGLARFPRPVSGPRSGPRAIVCHLSLPSTFRSQGAERVSIMP